MGIFITVISMDMEDVCKTCQYSDYGTVQCHKSGNIVGPDQCPRDASFDAQFDIPNSAA